MDDDSIDLGSLAGLLRRRLWLIAGVTVLVVAVAGIALFALRPVYTATALVLVDPSTKNLLDPETPLASASSDALRVESEVELVKSETTLLAVARELDIAADPEFGLTPGLADKALAFLRLTPPPLPSGDAALAQVMDNLRNAVAAERRGATFLIAVSARSARPDFAARIANAVARTYIGQQLDAKIASTLQSRDIVEARLADAGAGVARSEQAFDTFIEQNLARIGEATGRTDLAALNSRIAALANSRTTLAARTGSAEQALGQQDWAAVAASLQDQAVAALEKRRQALAARLAGTTADSGDAIDLKASLARLDGDLTQAAAKAVSKLKSELADTQVEATKLREQLRSAILAADLPPDILTGIYKVQQQAESARSQYQVLLARRNDLDNQAFLQVADSRIVSEALPPTEPSFPNPRLVLGLSGLIGLLLGVGCAVVAENFVGGFVSEAQAVAVLRVPVATTVPRQRQSRSDAGNVADRLVSAPLSAFAEAVRRLRLRLDQAVGHKPGTVVMVSSAAPGEGKTTMALALARAYALSGQSTLLVDCDLRKPGIHFALGRQVSDGLFDYLAGKAPDLGAIIALDSMSGAQVVLGSRRSDIATDQLVSGKAFARLLAAARENFDVVILDTPPVGPVVDGLYLAGRADAVVVVVEWAATPQQQVRAAVEALAGAGAAPLLAVLNRQPGGAAAYRGGYYAD